jgi:hypothetical protein
MQAQRVLVQATRTWLQQSCKTQVNLFAVVSARPSLSSLQPILFALLPHSSLSLAPAELQDANESLLYHHCSVIGSAYSTLVALSTPSSLTLVYTISRTGDWAEVERRARCFTDEVNAWIADRG